MALVTVLSAVVVGLTPAVTSSKPDLDRLLREGGHGGSTRKQRRMQSALVVSEISLAVMLLIASGLMIRTFRNLTNADPGLRTANILTMRVPLSETKYSEPSRSMAFYKELDRRVRALPGVESFAAVGYLPFIGYNGGIDFRIAGQSLQDRPSRSDIQPMTPDYFKIVGMSIGRGRSFLEDDWKVQPEVAIVNGMFARRFLGNRDPLGMILRLESAAGPAEPVSIVGVVNDVHQFGMYTDPRPEIYIPVTRRMMYLTVLTAGNPSAMASAVRQQVEQIDPEQTVINVRSFESVMSTSYASRRVLGILLSGLGAIALAMVTIAIYGIITYSVSQRSHEIGVRIALGANRRRVLGLIIHTGMRLTLIGILCGMLGAVALSRLLTRSLYGVTSTDPVTYFTMAAIVAIIGLIASYLPARRATRVDPIITLRAE
jgi:putative ABC transport system permease protein